MKVTILGCGASSGVPAIGCDCPVCTSDNPKNKRSRVSIFIEVNGINLLVDTSPDLRVQALANDIRRIDAVLFTHDHADHTGGIDDMRSFNFLQNDSIPVYGDARTMQVLQEKFSYIFQPKPQKFWYRGSLTPHVIPDILERLPVTEFDVSGVKITVFEQEHGRIKTLGYRIGNFVYSTDVRELSDVAFEAMAGTEVWVVDCLRHTESLTHSTVERTLGWIERVKPRLAILTHMGHELDYDTLCAELPDGVVPGHDNLVIEL